MVPAVHEIASSKPLHDGVHDEPRGEHDHEADGDIDENGACLLDLVRIAVGSEIQDTCPGKEKRGADGCQVYAEVDEVLDELPE